MGAAVRSRPDPTDVEYTVRRVATTLERSSGAVQACELIGVATGAVRRTRAPRTGARLRAHGY